MYLADGSDLQWCCWPTLLYFTVHAVHDPSAAASRAYVRPTVRRPAGLPSGGREAGEASVGVSGNCLAMWTRSVRSAHCVRRERFCEYTPGFRIWRRRHNARKDSEYSNSARRCLTESIVVWKPLPELRISRSAYLARDRYPPPPKSPV